jgi:hypothetical protein
MAPNSWPSRLKSARFGPLPPTPAQLTSMSSATPENSVANSAHELALDWSAPRPRTHHLSTSHGHLLRASYVLHTVRVECHSPGRCSRSRDSLKLCRRAGVAAHGKHVGSRSSSVLPHELQADAAARSSYRDVLWVVAAAGSSQSAPGAVIQHGGSNTQQRPSRRQGIRHHRNGSAEREGPFPRIEVAKISPQPRHRSGIVAVLRWCRYAHAFCAHACLASDAFFFCSATAAAAGSTIPARSTSSSKYGLIVAAAHGGVVGGARRGARARRHMHP